MGFEDGALRPFFTCKGPDLARNTLPPPSLALTRSPDRSLVFCSPPSLSSPPSLATLASRLVLASVAPAAATGVVVVVGEVAWEVVGVGVGVVEEAAAEAEAC
jgi:hypothetical protein